MTWPNTGLPIVAQRRSERHVFWATSRDHLKPQVNPRAERKYVAGAFTIRKAPPHLPVSVAAPPITTNRVGRLRLRPPEPSLMRLRQRLHRRMVIRQTPPAHQPKQLQIIQPHHIFRSPAVLEVQPTIIAGRAVPLFARFQLPLPTGLQPLTRPIHRRQPTTLHVGDLLDGVPISTHPPNPPVTRREVIGTEPPTMRIITVAALAVRVQNPCTTYLYVLRRLYAGPRKRPSTKHFRAFPGFRSYRFDPSPHNRRSVARQARNRGFLHSGRAQTWSGSAEAR